MKKLTIISLPVFVFLIVFAADTVMAQNSLIFTSGTDTLMTVKDDTTVGIGTTSPKHALQVGSEVSTATSAPNTLSLGGTYSSSAGQNQKLRMWTDGTHSYGFGVSFTQLEYIVTSSLADHVFYGPSSSELVRIDGATGNVGIGTTNPNNQLELMKSGGAGVLIDYDGSAGGVAIKNVTAGGWARGYQFQNSSGTSLGSFAAVGTGSTLNYMFLGTSFSSPWMAVTPSGNVGIGTSSPGGILDVSPDGDGTPDSSFVVNTNGGVVVGNPTGGNKGSGTVNASSVFDDNTLLTDYVFDWYFDGKIREEDKTLHGDYRMMSLEEMTAFMEKNRHLPTIVGRETWKKRGKASLGTLVTQLWETVETQAIYIKELKEEQQKIIVQQNTEIEDLKSKITQLEATLQKIEKLTTIEKNTDEKGKDQKKGKE